MDLVAITALGFTIFSFWWLYARRGRLTVTAPRVYAFYGAGEEMLLRLPLAFYNTGAASLVVVDLRLAFLDEADIGTLAWVSTRTQIEPASNDGRASAVPFPVDGRRISNIVAEFEKEGPVLAVPEPATTYRLVLQGKIGGEHSWKDLLHFDWHAPSEREAFVPYITYRNIPLNQ